MRLASEFLEDFQLNRDVIENLYDLQGEIGGVEVRRIEIKSHLDIQMFRFLKEAMTTEKLARNKAEVFWYASEAGEQMITEKAQLSALEKLSFRIHERIKLLEHERMMQAKYGGES